MSRPVCGTVGLRPYAYLPDGHAATHPGPPGRARVSGPHRRAPPAPPAPPAAGPDVQTWVVTIALGGRTRRTAARAARSPGTTSSRAGGINNGDRFEEGSGAAFHPGGAAHAASSPASCSRIARNSWGLTMVTCW